MFTNKKKITKYISTRRNTQCILDGIDKAPHIASFCLTISQEIITMQIISSSPSPPQYNKIPGFFFLFLHFPSIVSPPKHRRLSFFGWYNGLTAPLIIRVICPQKLWGKNQNKGKKTMGLEILTEAHLSQFDTELLVLMAYVE